MADSLIAAKVTVSATLFVLFVQLMNCKPPDPSKDRRDTDGLHRLLAERAGRSGLLNVVKRLTCRTRPAVESEGSHCSSVVAYLWCTHATPSIRLRPTTPRWERLSRTPMRKRPGRSPVAPESDAVGLAHPTTCGSETT